MMTTDFPGDGIEQRSLDEESFREADQYKWCLSEYLGYDAGPQAFMAWVNNHWPGFLRARWIEHLQGTRFWVELDRSEFGMLTKEFGEHKAILNEIVEMLKHGGENLTIFCWSQRYKQPE